MEENNITQLDFENINSVITPFEKPKLIYRITNWCNYKCSYCIQKTHNSLKPSDQNILHSTEELIQQIINGPLNTAFLQPRKVQLIGGEISFLDLVNDIMSPFLKSKINVESYLIISNFSAPIKNYKKIIDFVSQNNINLSLHLSFHEEFISYENFFKKFEELNNYCKNNSNIKLSIEMVVTLENLELAKKIKELYSNKYKIIFDKNRFESKNEVDNFLTSDDAVKTFDITFKSGRKLSYKKTSFFKAIGNSNFPSKGFICEKRIYNLKFDTCKNKLQVACKQAPDQFENILCNQEYCSLCNFKYLVKA